MRQLNLQPGDLRDSKVMVDLSRIFDRRDPARFSNMILFALAMVMNSMGWLTFAPITKKMFQNYGDNGLKVEYWNYLFCVYMLTFVPTNFVSLWVIEQKGLRTSIIIGTGLQLIGFWLRLFLKESQWYLIIGQVFLGVGQPFIWNMPSKLSVIWFPKSERSTALLLANNMMTVGCILSFIATRFFVGEYTKAEGDKFRDSVDQLLFIQAIA